MTTEDFITELFCKVDDQLNDTPKHPQALLYPSEVVTIGLLYAINRSALRHQRGEHQGFLSLAVGQLLVHVP